MKLFQLKHIIPMLLALLLGAQVSQAQKLSSKNKKAIKAWSKAAEHYHKRNYGEAVSFLDKALAADPDFLEALYLKADIAADTKKYPLVISTLSKALSLEKKPSKTTHLMLGKANHSLGNYPEAIKEYMQFKALVAGKEQKAYADALIASCYFAQQQESNPVRFDPQNLGEAINSDLNEYWPSLTADERTLIFTRLLPAGEKRFQEDFFIANKDSIWQKAQNMGAPTNTYKNEGAQSVSADGKTLVFTACGRKGGMGSCDLYISRKVKNKWTSPVNMGYPINTRAWESQPSLSADGKTLYFVSNRSGGKGKRDIWVSRLGSDGYWQMPVNLGDSINTEKDEAAPFIHPDEQTLYFASDGHLGMGSYDVFLSRHTTQGWTKAQNLGFPINSKGEERGLITNVWGALAFIASEREEGFGGLDIYQFEMPKTIRPKPVTFVKGIVSDIETEARLQAKVELINLSNSKSRIVYSDPNDGEFLMILPAKHRYAFNVWRKGYLFYSDHFDLIGNHGQLNPFILDIRLKRIRQNQRIILKNVFFDTDKYSLKKESDTELKKLASFMKSNPKVTIEIGGHTDNQGSKKHNETLSDNRAKAVRDFLIGNGIEAQRLSHKGYGFAQPIKSNDTAEGRAQNRRTEVKVLTVQ